MDSGDEEEMCPKRRRLHELFKKHEEREYKATEFKDFSNAEKELFFIMLKVYNKEQEDQVQVKKKIETTKVPEVETRLGLLKL